MSENESGFEGRRGLLEIYRFSQEQHESAEKVILEACQRIEELIPQDCAPFCNGMFFNFSDWVKSLMRYGMHEHTFTQDMLGKIGLGTPEEAGLKFTGLARAWKGYIHIEIREEQKNFVVIFSAV